MGLKTVGGGSDDKNIYLFIFSVLTHTEKCKVIAEFCSKLSELFFSALKLIRPFLTACFTQFHC